MTVLATPSESAIHQHIFLGAAHAQSERKTWTVIWLCGAMMCAEIAMEVDFCSGRSRWWRTVCT